MLNQAYLTSCFCFASNSWRLAASAQYLHRVMPLIDLSHPLAHGQASFPGDPGLSILPHGSFETMRCNVSKLAMGSHQGTHLDAMFHFVPGGKTLDQMPLDWFCGPAHVLRLPREPRQEITVDDLRPHEEVLVPGARILYETGWHRRFGAQNYFEDFPSLTLDAAEYLAGRGIRLLGMDTPTPSRQVFEVHHALLGREVVIIESLANLDKVPDRITFIGFPLNFQGRDGSPIRAVALVD